ncbi:Alpha-tocopherol transfer protein-like, partial [Pseudolycoriella hygida]
EITSQMDQQNMQTPTDKLIEFQDLIKSKSDLPQNIDKLLLLRFLSANENDTQKAEKMLRKNLKIRKKCPKLFQNRDVSSEIFERTRNVCQVFPMPKPTPEGYEIVIFRLKDKNPRNFVVKNVLRSNVTMLDAKFLSDQESVKGSFAVIDFTGFTFKHFLKTFTVLCGKFGKCYGKFVHQAAPWKPVRFHAIHCPAILQRFISIIGPSVRRNYMELANFHDDFEIVDEAIPKEYLPNEFGGSAGNIDDLHNDWIKVLESKREYILNDDNWKLGYN